nr:ACT domain-containing protein [Spelaeicoccus albus]
MPYSFVAGWITLQVHSALDAVGLTAAVSTALATAEISCNVIAGNYHDHLLVPIDRLDDALGVLRELTA